MKTSRIFEKIIALVKRKEVMISDHGYDELAEDGIFVKDIISGVTKGMLIEDYPKYAKGPCVLILQKDNRGDPNNCRSDIECR